MTELTQLIQQLDKCETTTQLPQIVKQLNKCILQTLSSGHSSDGLLPAFEAMTRKALPTEPNHRHNTSTSKAISLIIFDNMRQLLIKVESQKLSLSKDIISELLFMTIGSATENKCKLIELIVKISDSKTIENLLNDKYNNFLIKSLLNKLKNSFRRTNDFDDRNAMIFEWIISKMSSMDDHIHDIFPLTMRLIDEFRIKTKLIGLKTLDKLVVNCWSLLQTNGSDLLVFERLKNLLYSKETEVLEVVFDCILPVIDNFNASERQESDKQLVAFDKNDQILCQLLNNVSISSEITYRVIHMKFIDKFVVRMNSSAIKYCNSYLKVICDIIEEPIHQKNLDLIEVTIDSLNIYLKIVWIVIKEISDKCLLSLLKLSININESDLSSESKKRLIKKICSSISIIKNSDKTSFALLSEMIIKSKFRQELNESIVNSLIN